MPKVTNNRKFLKAIRHSASPIGNGSAADASAPTLILADHPELADLKSTDLVEVIKGRLNHPLPSERCTGTDMISTFLTSRRLAQFKPAQINEIIRLLNTLLLDRAENVRFGAIDALCYLSSISDETCDRLVQNNILQPIVSMLELYFLSIDSWTLPIFTDKKLTLNLYVDSFNLLTNLCGVSSQFVEALLSHTKIVDILRKGLQALEPSEKISFIPIAIATAQCLAVICEDERAYGKLVAPESTNNLSDVLLHIVNLDHSTVVDVAQASAQLYLKSLAISIASCHHFKQALPLAASSTVKEELLSKLAQIVDQVFGDENEQKTNSLISQLQEQIKQDMSSMLKNLNEMIPNYDRVKYRYLTKRNCLELLTNLLSSEEDEDEEFEVPDDEDDDSEMMDSCEDSVEHSHNCDPLLVLFCQQKGILQILITQLGNVHLSMEAEQLFSSHIYGKDILSTIQSTKVSALTLIHNLIASKVITQSEPMLSSFWQTVYILAFQLSSPESADSVLREQTVEIREEAINVAREFIGTFKDITLSMADLESLCTFAQQNAAIISSYTKVNIVRVMASVASGTILRSGDAPTESVAQFVEQISNLLLNGFRADTDLVLRAEILDSLIDIYSDDNQLTMQLFKRMNLLATLKEFAGQYRREMKGNTRIVKQNAVVSTVGLNLNRFIKYKQKVLR